MSMGMCVIMSVIVGVRVRVRDCRVRHMYKHVYMYMTARSIPLAADIREHVQGVFGPRTSAGHHRQVGSARSQPGG